MLLLMPYGALQIIFLFGGFVSQFKYIIYHFVWHPLSISGSTGGSVSTHPSYSVGYCHAWLRQVGLWVVHLQPCGWGYLFSSKIPVILLKTGRSHKHQPILLFAYYLTSVFWVVPATIANWQSSNVAGDTKKSAVSLLDPWNPMCWSRSWRPPPWCTSGLLSGR